MAVCTIVRSSFSAGFVERQGQDDGHGHAQDQLADAEEQRVGDQLGEVEGVEEGLEVLKADPGAALHAQQGPEILERDLSVPQRPVLEDDKVEQRLAPSSSTASGVAT